MNSKVTVTAISGGYNYSYVDHLITETYPRFKQSRIEFVSEDSDVRMYFDYPFDASDPVLKPARCSIAVVEEPYCIVPEFSHFIYHNSHLFDAVFTNHAELLELKRPNIHYLPGSGASVEEWEIFPKSKHACAIFSHKNYSEGHKLRQEIRNDPRFQNHPALQFINSVPYTPDRYRDKSTLIAPYRFSVAIENVYNTMIGDKAIDCFLTGTIPIYKGTGKITDYFEERGILWFQTLDDLLRVLEYVYIHGEEFYLERFQSVCANFERATRFADLSHMLWVHGLKDVFKQKGVI